MCSRRTVRSTRMIALAAALSVASFVAGLDSAQAGDEYRIGGPTPPASPFWTLCHPERLCGPHGCRTHTYCPPQTFASSYLWQVQDHWPAEALARYDDAWCRSYGPRGAPDYMQCLANNFYMRLSVPLRQTR